MNAQVKRLMLIALVMFITLMVATSLTQFYAADALNADTRNSRAILNAQGKPRGPIIVAGTPIVSSAQVESATKRKRYQRQYTASNGLYSILTGYYSLQGQSQGLERYKNDVLLGESATLALDRIGQQLRGQEQKGGALELTINPAVQQAAWDAIGNRRGAAVALDTKTGAILAAVSKPSYDPNPLSSLDTATARKSLQDLTNDPEKPLDNRAFGGHMYSPGSAFKLITASAMLSSGEWSPDGTVRAPSTISLPMTNKTLSNINHESCGGGRPTLKYAFRYSCNTPFALAGMKLGQEELQKMAEAYGFNKSFTMPLTVTASNFPRLDGENADKMLPPQLAYSSIGQYNVQATPLQMAMVAQTIANGGIEMKPYVVARELDSSLNPTKTTNPQKMGQPISEQVASQLTEMMIEVVERGTGRKAQVDGVQVAGKTGTAEVGSSGRADGWFVGFAPADSARIAFAVVIEGAQNGVDSLHGSEVAPVAAAMVKALIAHE